MKRTERPSGTDTKAQGLQPAAPLSDREAVLSRLKLAFLDDYTREKPGYDPYDTARHRSTPDIWMSKRKRA